MAISVHSEGASSESSAQTVECAAPGTITDGDLLRIQASSAIGVNISVNETGWTLVKQQQVTAGSLDGTVAVFIKIADSESGTYTVDIDGGTNRSMTVQCTAYSGVDESTPQDQTPTSNTSTAATSHDPAAITTLTANARVESVLFARGGGLSTPSVPSGYSLNDGHKLTNSYTATANIDAGAAGSEDPGVWSSFTANSDAASITWAMREAGAGGPSYQTNLTTFHLEGSTTVTAIGSGGAALGNPETDFFIQGANCVSKGAWTNAVKGFIIDGVAGTFTVPTDGAVIGFAKYDAQGSLDTQALGGFRMIIGSASNAYDEFYIGGSDTLEFDSWVPYVIDPNTATPDVANSGGAERWVGILADLPTTSGPTKGSPIGMDAIRYGRCDIEYTLGDSGTPCTFDGAEGTGNVVGTRWGLLELQKGAFQTQGFHSLGITGSPVHFVDSDKVLFWRKQFNCLADDAISTAFNRVEIIHADSVVEWTNILWSALGTRARGQFVHTAGGCDLDACQFFDWDTFTFLAATVATNCVFSRCRAASAPGSTLNGSSILTPDISANTSGLIWNVNTDPDGLLDDMTFTKTSGTAHHAIEFGLNSPTTSMILNGCAFGTDFSAGLDTTVGDETFHFLDTTGTITLNLVGCTGNKGYRSEGVVVTIVDDPVTTAITCFDTADPPVVIQDVRVFLEASDGTGPLPFEEAVTITQTAGTATVSHTAHGIPDATNVVIRGATQNGYNKVGIITVTSVNEYTYAVDSGTVSPATGSPIASGVLISDVTSVGGVASDTRTYASDQPFKGRARKSSAQPYYQNATIAGTVSTTLGFSTAVTLLSDE